MGGDITAFQVTRVSTEVPPAIEENDTYADLGPSRLYAKVKALELGKEGSFRLLVTPFARFGLPTDTSRTREERRMPVRGVIDDRVIGGPYFSIEPGVSAGFAIGIFSAYVHQSFPIVPIHDQDVTHVFFANHLGARVLLFDHLEVVGELGGLLRLTEAYDGERLSAWSVSPGLRWIGESLSLELSARFGLGDDSRDAYGLCTLFAAVAWTFN